MFSHYFVPNGRDWQLDTLYLAPEKASFRIDHELREFSGGRCQCTWTPWRSKAGDPDCSQTVRERSSTAKQVGVGNVAGQMVIRYRDTDESGYVEEFALAPALHCELMEETHTHPGTLGIPGGRWHYRVTSYVSGEPPRHVFALPPGYTKATNW
jgi:hypothetical protein